MHTSVSVPSCRATIKGQPGSLSVWEAALARIVADLADFHPRAVVLFGSAARWLNAAGRAPAPNDLDLLMAGLNVPFAVLRSDYGVPFELQFYKEYELIELARRLRYTARPMLLARLYGRTLLVQHARDIIAACLLLGPDYGAMGIEQIEINGRIDGRDYSLHHVLHGHAWWQRLSEYARNRRGPFRRWSDRLAGVENFAG